ncbi:acyltransferase [Sphingobium nicotianae]|uniref:Chloramphenicol acetyltransferase n=1 Tax=Sphingobium nicotianae TaxID=2782607 RepID=A0A9X1DDM3_9SPHN|nr:acyltransferase [Sphingobium nicotianae]MBT2188111.1 acyltransferase [Sphingobium nicotianae]
MTDHNAAYLDADAIGRLGFAEVGDDVRIHATAVVANCEAISIGSNVRIDAFTVLSAGTSITIADHVHIGSHCSLVGSEAIEIADFCGISHGTRIFSASDDYSGHALTGPTVPAEFRQITSGPVRLGRHVIIGSNTIVLPAVDIGEGAAIGAMSLVTKSLQGWTVYAGCPAIAIGTRSKALLEKAEAFRKSSWAT